MKYTILFMIWQILFLRSAGRKCFPFHTLPDSALTKAIRNYTIEKLYWMSREASMR